MLYSDLGEFLQRLEEWRMLYCVDAPVDKDWGISCIICAIFRGPPEEKRLALGFRNLRAFAGTLFVTGVVGISRCGIKAALDLGPEESTDAEVLEHMNDGPANPIRPSLVKNGMYQKAVLKGEEMQMSA